MSENIINLQAKTRVIFGKQYKRSRREGKLPAVLYGGNSPESRHIEVDADEFERVYKQAGESTLIDLMIDGEKSVKVLINDVARHFMKNDPIHVDFYQVDLTKKIRADVPLHFVGESSAEKELGGVLVKSISEVEIEALPAELPHAIEVDISVLSSFDDVIRIRDLQSTGAFKVVGNEETLVVQVQPPRTREELDELEKPTAEEEAVAVEGVSGEKPAEGAGEDDESKEKPADKSEKA